MTALGIMIEGQFGLTWERWARLLDAAENLGYDSLFRSDHYTIGTPQESLETFISLTYAATHTSRIQFGPLVAPVTFRHPSLTARMGAQIDDLSNGRLVLGLGAGWNESEHREFGVPFHTRKERFDMLEDALEMTRLLYTSDEPVQFQGKHFSLDGAILLPRPRRAGGPPILIGGSGKNRTLPLAAEYASEWNVPFVTPEKYRELSDHLTELLKERGRDPKSVKRSFMTTLTIGRTDAEVREKTKGETNDKAIAGTISQVVDRIGVYVEAGVERFMLQWLDLDDIDGLELIASQVLPQFHK
jgi:F420-dependent oxidoreductase-like protein